MKDDNNNTDNKNKDSFLDNSLKNVQFEDEDSYYGKLLEEMDRKKITMEILLTEYNSSIDLMKNLNVNSKDNVEFKLKIEHYLQTLNNKIL